MQEADTHVRRQLAELAELAVRHIKETLPKEVAESYSQIVAAYDSMRAFAEQFGEHLVHAEVRPARVSVSAVPALNEVR